MMIMMMMMVSLTLAIMHFQDPEPRNIISQHDPVGTRGLVHTLYDLKVPVSEVEVVLVDSHTPGVRQAGHYGYAVTSIWITALNLWRARKSVKLALLILSKYWDDVVKNETHHACACHSPVQLVIFDVHSDELNVIKVGGEQDHRV